MTGHANIGVKEFFEEGMSENKGFELFQDLCALLPKKLLPLKIANEIEKSGVAGDEYHSIFIEKRAQVFFWASAFLFLLVSWKAVRPPDTKRDSGYSRMSAASHSVTRFVFLTPSPQEGGAFSKHQDACGLQYNGRYSSFSHVHLFW